MLIVMHILNFFFFDCAGTLLLCRLSLVAGSGDYSLVEAQELCYMGLVALRHVGSSWIRDQTRVSCSDRQILHHWAAREAPLHFLSYFLIEMQLIYNIVLVSGTQQRNSIISMYIFISFKNFFHYSLLQYIKYSSLCYIVSLCLCILFIVVCIS